MRRDARFLGVRLHDWYVIANLACIALVAALVTLAIGSIWGLRWYWLFAVFLVLVWPISYVVERFPIGTLLVHKITGDRGDRAA